MHQVGKAGLRVFRVVALALIMFGVSGLAQTASAARWYTSAWSCAYPNCDGKPITLTVRFRCETSGGQTNLWSYVYMQEHGKSGITQFKYRLELEVWGQNAFGQFKWQGSRDSYWRTSTTFMDTARNHMRWSGPDPDSWATGNQLSPHFKYRIKVKAVWVKPGKTRPDIVRYATSSGCGPASDVSVS
jgi:hypothetical protein